MNSGLHKIVAAEARRICRQIEHENDTPCEFCCEIVADIGFSFMRQVPKHVLRMKPAQLRAAFQSACYNA